MSQGFKRLADGLNWIRKVPADNLDYSINYGDELQEGETISASVWTVPPGLTAGVPSWSGPYATQWLSAGAIDAVYVVVNRVTTSAGRVFERAFKVKVVSVLG